MTKDVAFDPRLGGPFGDTGEILPFPGSEPPVIGQESAAGETLPLTTISLATFHGNPAPQRKWIVEGLIPARNVTDLAGDGGTGKSILALQLSVAMATSTYWIGYKPKPGLALYLSCEDEFDEIRRRVEAITAAGSIELSDLTDLHIIDLTVAPETELATASKGRLSLTALYHRLAATIETLCPRLVVLDTRADVFGGSEVDRVQVRGFVRALRRLCFEHDLAILMLSHPSLTGMASGSGQSGSTAWGNSVRSRLYLERPKTIDETEPDPGLRILTAKKSNYSGTDVTITLHWKDGVFSPEGTGLGMFDRMARDNTVEERFLNLLRDFDRQGRHVNNVTGPYYAPKQFAAATNGEIGHKQFRAAMERLFAKGALRIEPYGSPSRGTKKIVAVN